MSTFWPNVANCIVKCLGRQQTRATMKRVSIHLTRPQRLPVIACKSTVQSSSRKIPLPFFHNTRYLKESNLTKPFNGYLIRQRKKKYVFNTTEMVGRNVSGSITWTVIAKRPIQLMNIRAVIGTVRTFL